MVGSNVSPLLGRTFQKSCKQGVKFLLVYLYCLGTRVELALVRCHDPSLSLYRFFFGIWVILLGCCSSGRAGGNKASICSRVIGKRACSGCGGLFQRKRPWQKQCSPRCLRQRLTAQLGKQSLVGSGPCDRGCRFGLLGCGGLCRLSRRRLGLRLPVRLIIVLGGADLHAAFQNGSILNADALGDHVSRQ